MNRENNPTPSGSPPTRLPAERIMETLIRSANWNHTSLGPISAWPQSIRTALDIALGMHLPAALCLGNDLHLVYNDAWRELIGADHPAMLGASVRLASPSIINSMRPILDRMMATGWASHHEVCSLDIPGTEFTPGYHLRCSLAPLRGEAGEVQGIFISLSETAGESSKERMLRFLVELNTATQQLADADAIISLTARMLGEHLGVNRCAYAEVEADEDHFTITGDYTNGTFSIVGHYALSTFGEEALRLMRANQSYVVDDVETDPKAGPDLSAYQQTGIRSIICVPLHKAGRFVAGMAVHQSTPRHWTAEEVEIVELVVARCWEAIERARVVRSLRESQQRLSLAQRAGRIGVFEWLIPEGRVIWTPELEALYGLPAGTFKESFDEWRTLVDPGDGDRITAEIDECVRERRESYTYEFRATLPNGAQRWLAGQALFLYNNRGEPLKMIGVNIDIDARKRAEQLRQEIEARFRHMADTAPATLWITNPQGECIFLSKGWYDFTGQTQGSGLGLGWMDAVHPDDREHASMVFLEANEARKPFALDYRLRGTDGEYRWAIDAGRPHFAGDGTYLGYVGSVFDIHDRKQAEQALKEADRRKDEFLATLAHELRNPLAPIRTGLEVMKVAGDEPELMEEVRSMLERQTQLMVRLIDDLLEVSRITRGKLKLRKGHVELAQIIHTAVETSRHLFEEAGHELRVDLPEEPVILDADPTRLAQVFSNLLNNAARYTPKGGRIRVAAEKKGDDVIVSVRDTGIGIPHDMLGRIFEMFVQVDRSLERVHTGLGIGLTIVKQLVEMHGGSVAARSEGPNQGSEFVVRLPLAKELSPAAPPKHPAGAGLPAPGHRILLVDDNPDIVTSLSMYLQLSGYEVHTANDGAEGVAAAERIRPDIVVLDIGMPKMNGYDAARTIRQQSWGKKMALVALTGWGQEEDRRRSQESGFDHHLVKPVDPAALRELLATLAPG